MSLRKAFLEEVTFALSLEGTPKTWCSAGERQEEEKAFRAECGALGFQVAQMVRDLAYSGRHRS